MTMQPFDSIEELDPRAWGSHVLASAATLAVLGLIAVLLLRPWDRTPEPTPAAPVQAHEGAVSTSTGSTAAVEKGGLAELYDDLGQAKSPANPITVYLVANEAQAEEVDRTRMLAANESGGLPEDALVLVMGSPEEQALADATLRYLALQDSDGVARVVDLRRPAPPE